MATFTFIGQDANNSHSSKTLVVNDTGALDFTFDSGAENFLGDDPDTGTNEAADDLVSYTNYDGVVITDATFTINYVGDVNWANGNPPIDPDESTKVMIIEITSGPEAGQFYTIIVGDPPPPGGTFGNGNHRASPTEDLIVCFVRGTKIATPDGEKLIEDIVVGDGVLTADSGTQVVRWIGSAKLRPAQGMRPIRIKAGALGENRPYEDLLVSPAHRMLISGWRAELLFDEPECLVAAKDLVNDDTIVVAHDLREVEYFHMLFDKHEIVTSNGAPSESFHPNADALDKLDEAARDEVLALFPELKAGSDNSFAAARPTISALEATLLGR
ncbi:MAG: Hint domain-containing protein [Paracoccaceae bacterium]